MILAGIFFIFLFLFFVFVFASSSSPLLSLSLFFFYFSSPLFLLRSHPTPTLTSFFHLLSVILIHIRLKFILGNARPFSKIQLQARPSFSHIYQSVIHFTDGFSRRLIRLRLKISSAATREGPATPRGFMHGTASDRPRLQCGERLESLAPIRDRPIISFSFSDPVALPPTPSAPLPHNRRHNAVSSPCG